MRICHLSIEMGLSFVLPSILETFGVPIIEAMASGVPVIASSASVLPEIVGDAGVLFDPNDPTDLARKIRAVVSDETAQCFSERLQRAGYSHGSDCRETLAVLRDASTHKRRDYGPFMITYLMRCGEQANEQMLF